MLRRKGSIRLWQTELFIIVIVVAILILSGSLSAGLRSVLSGKAEEAELRNASALALRLQPELPVTVDSIDRIRDVVAEYRRVYGDAIWVYDNNGSLLVSAYDVSPSATILQRAEAGGLAANRPWSTSDLQPGGFVVASQALQGPGGSRQGVVVTASSVDDTLQILNDVRDRMWITLWVSLGMAGLVGFGFSELIGRRIRAMSDAAVAIADGDFEQRLPIGFVPDEVQDMAVSYNRMAGQLGAAFGELQESRRELAAVVDSMAEGLVAFDPAGAVRVMNPEACRLLGTQRCDATPASARDLTTEDGVLEVVDAGLAGRTAARTVALGQHVVLLHCTPLTDAEGRTQGAVLLLADVTEQNRIEDAQRRFVADASHEMRTPLTALKGMLELLVDGAKDDPDVRDDFMATMQEEADRLTRLVNDLLTLAKLDAGGLAIKSSAVPVSEILNDVSRVMRGLAEQAGVELRVEVPEGDVRVLAERDKIVQVLLSFTDNALKHSPEGSTIRLRAERRGECVVLGVADEGRGIGPDEIDRVFERFYRIDAARAGGKGTGLGLAIAKEIVEAHDSTIRVESTPGEGTDFWFELPAA